MSEPFPEADRDIDADHLVETPQSLRDSDPEAPPMDRGSLATDRPLGAEKFGTTHSEEALGEPLDDRLAQEVPDVDEHDPVEDIVADDPGTFADDPGTFADDPGTFADDPGTFADDPASG